MKPEIGIHRNVPAHVYHSWEAASASRLNAIRQRSPLHMRWEADHPSDPTPALVLGEAAHTLILQPELFDGRYLIAGDCCDITAKGKPCGNAGNRLVGGKWFCGVHHKGPGEQGDRIILSHDDHAKVEAMAYAVHANPWAHSLLEMRTDTELSIVWPDAETGVLCKARMDVAAFGSSLIWDLKTTLDASPDQFSRSLANFGYDLQAAHYLEAAQHFGHAVTDFCFLCVEKQPPHAVAVYRVTDRNLSAVREHRTRLLATYGECVKTGVWPGYANTIQDIEVPAWEMKKLETALVEA